MAHLLNTAFEGLLLADFEAFAPASWSSNQFNLVRMRAKERMLQLAAPWSALPGAADLSLSASSEIPGVWNGRFVRDQRVYLLRNSAERQRLEALQAQDRSLSALVHDAAEDHGHANVFARLHDVGLEIGLAVPALATVDRAHLVALMDTALLAAGGGELLSRLSDLPVSLALDGGPATPAFASAVAELSRGQRPALCLSTTLTRDAVLASGAGLADQVSALVEALLPILDLVRFRAGHDPAGVEARLAGLEARRATAATERATAEAESERQRKDRADAARARTTEREESDAAWRRVAAEARAARPAPTRAPVPPAPGSLTHDPDRHRGPSRGPKVLRVPAPRQTEPRPMREPEGATSGRHARATNAGIGPDRPAGDQERAVNHASRPGPPVSGDRVRLSRGMLAGKEGVVTADAGNGGYVKVRVGALEVSVLATEAERI